MAKGTESIYPYHYSLITHVCFTSFPSPSCREYARTIPRPFSVRYNPYTQSIEVINDKASVANLVRDIKYEVDILEDALSKLQ